MAETKAVNVNINWDVVVKLTSHGKAIYDKDYGFHADKYADDGTIILQMWNFMIIFGRYLYCGAEQIIVNNEMSVKMG